MSLISVKMKRCLNIINYFVGNKFFVLSLFGFVLFDGVEGRRCEIRLESGQIKEFYCNAYEFCCGSLCCRARSIGFFQLWYFWLLMMLMLLLCSGGGWWVRYRRRYQMGMPPFGMPTATPAARNFSGGTGFQQTCGQPAQPPPPYGAGYPTSGPGYPSNGPGYPTSGYPTTGPGYPTSGPTHNPQMYPTSSAGATPFLPQTGPQPPQGPHNMYPQFVNLDQSNYGPAPQYMGPPPSYAAATAKPS